MSVLEIKSHIEKETEIEVQDILRKAETEAKTIIEDAKKKAGGLLEEQIQKRGKEELTKEKSDLAILRMNYKTELVKVKTQWLNRTFEEAKKRLENLGKEADSAAYKELIMGLVIEGMSKMKGSKFVIKSNNHTHDLLKKNLSVIIKSTSKIKGGEVDLTLESNSDIPSGVIIQSSDKRQYYNNTLEARISNARQRLSGQFYSLLFKEM